MTADVLTVPISPFREGWINRLHLLKAGIIGLPNTGKSTLLNALTRTHKAEVANYPFCTIEPNIGVVSVPEDRLGPLASLVAKDNQIPATIEFVDIAGLVPGASQGEGLGNQFLGHIREVDAIIEVIRCYNDEEVIHHLGSIDPVRDIEIVSTELILSDLQSVERQMDRTIKRARGGDRESTEILNLLERLQPHLNAGQPASTLELHEEESAILRHLFLLTSKPVLYACNIAESDAVDPISNAYVADVHQFARQNGKSNQCVICGKLEEDLADLSPEEATQFLKELGVPSSGIDNLICATYSLLGLATFFTIGEDEVRAWSFTKGMTAPQCAGTVHTDFEKGFIKAEVVSYNELINTGSILSAREKGRYRIEGKDYRFQDGDVAFFRFQ